MNHVCTYQRNLNKVRRAYVKDHLICLTLLASKIAGVVGIVVCANWFGGSVFSGAMFIGFMAICLLWSLYEIGDSVAYYSKDKARVIRAYSDNKNALVRYTKWMSKHRD